MIAFRILSGARAGHVETTHKSVIHIGRHPLSDLRLDPERDLEVSARHAEIRVVGNKIVLFDQQSTNGTFVNGTRLTAPRSLCDGDVIIFGDRGPKVEVVLAPRSGSDHVFGIPPAMRVAPGASRRPVKSLVGLGALLLLGGLAGAYWIGHGDADRRAAQVDTLLRQNDSLAALLDAQLRAVSGRVAGLDSMLALAREETVELERRLLEAREVASETSVEALSVEVERARLRRIALTSAAQVDYAAIADSSGGAVVLVAVEMPDGRSYTGTGFNVRRDGVIVTNRHLVQGEDGRPPSRLAVLFADTRRWLRARVTRVSDADDLAILRLAGDGPFPVVAGVAAPEATPRVGVPVALIGYPLGIDTPMDANAGGTAITARTSLSAGTVGKVIEGLMQIDAYAGRGSSGTPVFDRRGMVVGVVYGGARASGGRIVYAVPTDRLHAFVARDLTAPR